MAQYDNTNAGGVMRILLLGTVLVTLTVCVVSALNSVMAYKSSQHPDNLPGPSAALEYNEENYWDLEEYDMEDLEDGEYTLHIERAMQLVVEELKAK